MQPRESIPNVGRRAQVRKTVLVLKGSGMNGPSAATRLLQRADQRSPQQSQDTITFGDSEGGRAASFGESALSQPGHADDQPSHPYNQPSHPYNQIIQRILHRHQVVHRQQSLNGTNVFGQREKCVQDDHAAPRVRNNLATGTPCHSDPHPNQRPKERTRNTGRQPHWQASVNRTRRWSEGSQQQYRGHSRSNDQPVTSMGLDRGCVTERTPACNVRPGDASKREESLATTRSEPGGGDAFGVQSRVTRKRDPGPLDELLDYFWVYQGMGRQVLNLDMPRDAWDTKLFKKPAKLPPIPISTGQKAAALTPSEGSSGHAENGRGLERRAVSEPAYIMGPREPQGCITARLELESQESERPAQRCAESERPDFEVDGVALGSRTRTQIVGGRRGKVKLVVKMPVLTQEMSCADLLEKE